MCLDRLTKPDSTARFICSAPQSTIFCSLVQRFLNKGVGMPDKKFLGACSPRVRSPAQKSARRAAAPVGSAPRRDLIEPELFGNEAGDDEPVEVLSSYFLDKPEFEPFYQPATKLAFV